MSQPADAMLWRSAELLVLLSAVVIRVLVGLSSYSGAGHPPKYGDYEAQRHWMEITVNTPPEQWYTSSSANNESYWPLDYPPLSGWQSYIHGQFLLRHEPEAVALYSSQGYETASSKRLMRTTVLASDIAVFFPAAWLATAALHGATPSQARAWTLAALLLNPANIIIDHGHFQYNCISLGFALAAAAAISRGWHILGSVLFCGALNHKQMSLYYAPAFFAHLLGRCFQARSFVGKVGGVAKLGVVVVATFYLIWLPWLTSVEDALKVVARIFPLRRGLFEDYVSNFWCATSVAIKWKQLAPDKLLIRSCAGLTLAGALPSMVQQIRRPSSQGLLLAMANSGFSFFMFAYQVHEKSVMLPLLPVTALAASQPGAASWMPVVAMMSMHPLLERDGLNLPYTALILAWTAVAVLLAPRSLTGSSESGSRKGSSPNSSAEEAEGTGTATAETRRFKAGLLAQILALLEGLPRSPLFCTASLLLLVALHAAKVLVAPPAHLPWLWDRAFTTVGFLYLAVIAGHLQLAQWQLPDLEGSRRRRKQKLP